VDALIRNLKKCMAKIQKCDFYFFYFLFFYKKTIIAIINFAKATMNELLDF
jgi:hypothetical protein